MALSAAVKLEQKSEKLLKDILKNLTPGEVVKALLRKMDMLAAVTVGEVQSNSLSGQRLKTRTGGLKRSVIGFSELVNGVPAIRVGIFKGPALAYANIQEQGTVGAGGTLPTIVPKKAKALAIPTDAAEKVTGKNNRVGPRDFPTELRFLPFRNSGVAIGKLVDAAAADQLDDDGLSVYDAPTLYILMKKIDLPPTFWLSAPVKAFLPVIAKELAMFLGDLARGRTTI